MSSSPARAFPWLLTVLAAAAFAVLVSLGVWQMQRLAWKEGLLARADAAASRPPVPIQETLADGPDAEFRRVFLVCRGLPTAPYVELRSLEGGQGGVRLISLCHPDGFQLPILVDRGFVSDVISARPPVQESDQPFVVAGVLRRVDPPGRFTPDPDGRFFYARDRWRMADALGGPTPANALMVFATNSSNPEWEALSPSSPPPAFTNNHLGYALTWFGLAAALLGVYAAFLWRLKA